MFKKINKFLINLLGGMTEDQFIRRTMEDTTFEIVRVNEDGTYNIRSKKIKTPIDDKIKRKYFNIKK